MKIEPGVAATIKSPRPAIFSTRAPGGPCDRLQLALCPLRGMENKMGLFDAIATSAANLTDNIVGMVNQNHQNKVNLRLMREQNAFNAAQAQIRVS